MIDGNGDPGDGSLLEIQCFSGLCNKSGTNESTPKGIKLKTEMVESLQHKAQGPYRGPRFMFVMCPHSMINCSLGHWLVTTHPGTKSTWHQWVFLADFPVGRLHRTREVKGSM